MNHRVQTPAATVAGKCSRARLWWTTVTLQVFIAAAASLPAATTNITNIAFSAYVRADDYFLNFTGRQAGAGAEVTRPVFASNVWTYGILSPFVTNAGPFKNLETRATNLEGATNGLTTRVGDAEFNISALNTYTEGLETEINALQAQFGAIGVSIDGGGSAISTGVKGEIFVPNACTVTEWTLLADQSGSIVIDVWVDSYANYPPTDADSITAAAPPTLSSVTKNQSSSLTGWTTSIAAGSTIRWNVDSATTVTRATLLLKVTQ